MTLIDPKSLYSIFGQVDEDMKNLLQLLRKTESEGFLKDWDASLSRLPSEALRQLFLQVEHLLHLDLFNARIEWELRAKCSDIATETMKRSVDVENNADES